MISGQAFCDSIVVLLVRKLLIKHDFVMIKIYAIIRSNFFNHYKFE